MISPILPSINEPVSAIQEFLDDFISRLDKLEYRVDDKAQHITVTLANKEEQPLSFNLGNAITDYKRFKSVPALGQLSSVRCLQAIQVAITNGVIHFGEGVANKVKQLEDDNSKLQEENTSLKNQLQTTRSEKEKLAEEYILLRGQYQELEKRLQTMFKDKTEYGDITEG